MTTTITIKDKAVNATYQNVTGLTGGAGVDAVFDVVKTNGVYTASLDSLAASAGSGYVAGDTITILGSALGGVNGTNNLILTVATVGTAGKIATFGAVGTGRVGDGTVDVAVDVTGTTGIDTYTLNGASSEYTITKAADKITAVSTVATNVTFTLADHERVVFDNKGIDLFKFDETNFKDEVAALKLIDNFVSEFDELKVIYKPKIYDKIISFYSEKPIEVHGYASRDADPSAIITGGYSPCNGFGDGTRGQYNQCLSQARANKIADMLKKRLPFLNFVGVGHGETDKFNGVGWTPQKTRINNKDTALNRRFQVFLPTYELKNIPKDEVFNVQTPK